MIEIYPNRLEAKPIETHTVETRMTIAAFLDGLLAAGYTVGEPLAVSIWVDDERVPLEQWGAFVFKPSERVRIHMEPKGTDPFSITVALFAGVKAVFGMLIPKLPGTPNSPGQGDQFGQGSVRGNKIKMGDPVREIAGQMKVYPDYLLPPRKYFVNEREQWTELALCVGVGRMQILASNVRIGDTSLLALGAEADYRIFEPGESVAGYSAFDWWHTAPEVGASSTGAAGLELTASSNFTVSPSASAFNFNAYTISIPSGAGSFPADWAVGLVLRVIAPYTYTVTDGGAGVRDIVAGPLAMLAPVVGNTIEVVGANAGRYIVNSYNAGLGQMTLNYANGSPATALVLGSGQAAIGPDGLRFRITSFSTSTLTVERLTSAGATDVTFPGFTAGTLAGASVQIDASNFEAGWRGPFPACPVGEKTWLVEVELFYPNGLGGINQNGDFYPLTASYEVQWRDMAVAGAWTSVVFSDTNYTMDQIGVNRQIALPYLMRPEIRLRKTAPLAENLEWRDTIQWYAMRCRFTGPTSYPGATVIGIKVRTSDRISSQTESLVSVIATRILPRLIGGVWQPEGPTRNLADFAAYIPRSLGYPDSRTNMTELARCANIWNARGDTFDMSYDFETTAQQALADVFGAGFAELTLDRGQITPVRDEPRTVYEQMYTPQNMVGYLQRTPKLVANPDEFDGVDVTFTDATTWTEATQPCRLPGDLGVKVEKITAVGVTNRTKAYQIGMRRRRIQRYRPDTYSWQTEADALVSRYLSFCAVVDDVNGYPQSALMMAFELLPGGAVLITSSEPLDWSKPGTYSAMLRKPDGTADGPYTATRVDDYRFTVPALGFVPDVTWQRDPPHLLFGASSRPLYSVLITSIDPNGFSSARVEAVGYDARVYLSDDAGPT